MFSALSAEEARLLGEMLKRCATALDDAPSDSQRLQVRSATATRL